MFQRFQDIKYDIRNIANRSLGAPQEQEQEELDIIWAKILSQSFLIGGPCCRNSAGSQLMTTPVPMAAGFQTSFNIANRNSLIRKKLRFQIKNSSFNKIVREWRLCRVVCCKVCHWCCWAQTRSITILLETLHWRPLPRWKNHQKSRKFEQAMQTSW